MARAAVELHAAMPTSTAAQLVLHALRPLEPAANIHWDLPLTFTRKMAHTAWSSVADDQRLSSISREHLRLDVDGAGAQLTCIGQRVRVRNLPGGDTVVLHRGDPPLRVFAGCVLDLAKKLDPDAPRLPLSRWNCEGEDPEIYFSLELRPAAAEANDDDEAAAAADVDAAAVAELAPLPNDRPLCSADAYDERRMIERLISALPPAERRGKEPDPDRLYEAHHVPPVRTGLLRVVTYNLLNDSRVALGMGGMHAVWDTRRINALRNLLALDADVILLQELNNNESKEDVEERKKLPPRIDGTRLDLFMGGGSSARVDERLTAAAAQEDDDEGGDNDDNFSRWSSRDGRNGNNKRAAGVTRVDSRAVGRQKKVGGSYGKSIEFLRKTLGETHTLVGGGTGVLFRHAPHPTRGVWVEQAGDRIGRKLIKNNATILASVCHIPLRIHGIGPPRPFIATSVHVAVVNGLRTGLVKSDKESKRLGEALGRDLLRLPSHFGQESRNAVMVIGGDFNVGKTGLNGGNSGNGGKHGGGRGHGGSSKARAGSPSDAASSVYGELVQRDAWANVDSEDEWSEDENAVEAWPPSSATSSGKPLATDLWQACKEDRKEYGGLQRGSTCTQAGLQNTFGLQGIAARARNESWPVDGPCTDRDHIDWLLASNAGANVKVRSVGVCTERVCPPLPPRQPSECGPTVLPPGGKVFGSDHYPVWADLDLGRE